MKFIVSESKPVLRARPPRKAACLLTALVLAFCNADSRATSSNTVNVPISGNAITYAILANPYNHGGNTVAEIFSASKIPSGTAVYKYIALGSFQNSSFADGAWTDPALVINPGEGFFLSFNSQAARGIAATLQLNLSGEPANSSKLPISGQYALVGSPIDKPGLLVKDLGYPVSEGDLIYKFNVNSQTYTTDDFMDGQWDSGSEPRLGFGEGFFLLRHGSSNLPAQWNGAAGGSSGQFMSMDQLGGSENDAGQAVSVDPNGNVFVAGSVSWVPFVAKYSAANALLWNLAFIGPGSGSAQAIVADNKGNIYVTGNFGGSLNFGGGLLSSAGGYDIFVAKYSSAGAHLWSKRFGSARVNTFVTESGFGIAIDPNNNAIVVTGTIDGTVDFGGGPLTSTSPQDLFLLRLSTDGGFMWSKRAGGSSPTIGSSVAIDQRGNVFLSGTFASTVDFGGGPLTALGAPDVFVAKYSANGSHVWSKHFGDRTPYPSSVTSSTMALDTQGNVVLAGSFQSTINFGGQALTSAGNDDIFLAKYAGGDGGHLWSKRFGAIGTDSGTGIAVDKNDNITLAGRTGSALDFGSGPLNLAKGVMNGYVANFSSDGTARWSKSFGLAYGDLRAVAVDSTGTSFATGRFAYTVDFGGGPVTSAGRSWDVFLIEFAP